MFSVDLAAADRVHLGMRTHWFPEIRPRRSLVLACVLSLGGWLAGALEAKDVKSFGATGDGKADDTAAIQRAVDGGGDIEFAKGVYRLTRTVTIPLDQTGFVALVANGTARVVMEGAGPAFKFVGTHAGSADPEQFKPNVWERQRGPRVDGLEIVGAHAEADGIEATGTMQITITHVQLRELRHGVHLTVRNRNVLIANAHIYHCRGIGIYYDQVNLHQSNISGCHISYCAGGGIVSRGGNVRNVHIGTCDIESNMGKDGPPTANILLDSAGGSIGEVAITGCTIQHNSSGPDSANIRILGRGDEPSLQQRIGSAVTQEGHVTITGNVLSDVQVNIHVKDARGVTITGNTFWMGYRHDLLVEDSTAVIVGPNNFDRNPRYSYGSTANANGGLVFRGSRDSTLTGLHVSGAWRNAAALHVQNCERFNISDCSILDSDGVGLWLQDSKNTRVAGCVIRDDRSPRAAAPAPSLRVTGGQGNWIAHNLLGQSMAIAPNTAKFTGNVDGSGEALK